MTKSSQDNRTRAELLEEIEQLSVRLDEAEQTIDAIRSGDVDALVVTGPQGDQVFSLTGAERTYRLIIETMNEAALTVDLAGTILFCNQRFSRLVKCAMTEIIGRKITTFVSLAQQLPLQQLIANAKAGPLQQCLTLRASDDTAVSVQIAASPLVDAGHTCICLVASDLTELEAQADSIRVLLENQKALEESKIELQATNAALHQSRLEALNVSEEAIAARRRAEELASQLLQEIKERQLAEQALRESETLYRSIGESIDFGVWICAPDGRNTYASESFLKMVGITQEQCSDFGWGNVLHPEDADRTIAAWQECVRTEGKWDIEHRFRGADNQWHYVLARGVPVRNDQGKITCWAGINLDISQLKQAEQQVKTALADKELMNIHLQREVSERKKAEEKLLALNQELERRVEQRTLELQQTQKEYMHVEKLSAIGKLSASIAHEFNNPLQGIMSVFLGLKDRAVLDEEDKVLLDEAIKECDRIKVLIRSLQEFSCPSTGIKTLFNVHNSLDSLILLHKNDFKKKRISVVLDYADQLPQIEVVPDQIKQVFLNLLTNAADACHQSGGEITIKTWQEDEKCIAVSIKDTGIGIQPSDLESIFQPFFTTKPELKGSGLGLSISYGIVEKHHGKLRVESQPGEGATFTVLLPIKYTEESAKPTTR